MTVPMINFFLVAFFALNLIYCILLPLNSWIYARLGFPNRARRLRGAPDVPVCLLLLVVETAVSVGLLGAAVFIVVALATGGFSWQVGTALASMLMIMVNGLLVKAPYAGRRDMPIPYWFLVPLFGHFIVALSFWLAISPKMRWGKMTLEFNKGGTIREIRNRGH
jgi:hypothetical protein